MFGDLIHFPELDRLRIKVQEDYFVVELEGRLGITFEANIKFEIVDIELNKEAQYIKLRRLEQSQISGKSYFKLLAIIVRLVFSMFGQDLADMMLTRQSPIREEEDGVFHIDLSQTKVGQLLKKEILNVKLGDIYELEEVICEDGEFKIVSTLSLEDVVFGHLDELKKSGADRAIPTPDRKAD